MTTIEVISAQSGQNEVSDSQTVKIPNPHLWTVREDHIWNFRSGPMKQRVTSRQMHEESIQALITLDQRIQQTKWKDVADDKINKIKEWRSGS